MTQRSSYSEHDEQPEFWFNTKTGEVEVGFQTAAAYRIGPFASREEAARALEIVAERARQLRLEDAADDD
ncbi:MAG: hypothetical protein KGL41_01490 [Actinomycetales bacterium]|nr:hypothetical protein [Actinomycetales bacterium]